MDRNKTAKQLAELTFNLSTVYQEKFNALADAKGLCHAELKCILTIGTFGKLNNKEVAKQMGLSPSRLTRIVRGCVVKGYINREFNQKDWRELVLTLTRKGKALNIKFEHDYIDAHYRILKRTKSTQRKPLIKLMEKLTLASEKKLSKRN